MPWTSQPPAGTPIDWTNQFAKSLVGGFTVSDGAQRSLSRKNSLNTAVIPAPVANRYGLGLVFNGTSNKINTPAIDLSASMGVTITSVLGGNGSQNGKMLFEQSPSADTNDGFYIYGISATQLRFEINTFGAAYSSVDITFTLPTTPQVVTFVINSEAFPATIKILVNGIVQASGTTVSAGYLGNDVIYIGSRAGSSLWSNQTFGDTFIHAGAMPLNMAAAFAANPWQIFQP